jgi:hypothetical protein
MNLGNTASTKCFGSRSNAAPGKLKKSKDIKCGDRKCDNSAQQTTV